MNENKNRFMKKYIIFIFLFIIALTTNANALDWDILNEDCAGIGDWTNNDAAFTSTTQMTFDSKSCFQFQALVPATAGTSANIYRAVTIPDTFTLEFDIYIDQWNSSTEFMSYIYTTSKHRYGFGIDRGYISLYVNASWINVDLPNIEDEWHVVRFVVKAGRKLDVWFGERCLLADYSCSFTSTASNLVSLRCYSDATTQSTTYIDNYKIDTTPEAPITISPLKIHDEEIVTRWRQPGGSYLETDLMRMYMKVFGDAPGSGVCGIPLVATGDTNASKVRVYDGSTVKSLMKLPN